MKNGSNATAARSALPSATSAMGRSTFANFASWTFFSMTRFEPLSRTIRSSFGRLNAAVWTPFAASPAARSSFTTRMGAIAPSFGFFIAASMGSASSIPCSSAAKRWSFAVSASSRTAMNASNAAFALNQPSS